MTSFGRHRPALHPMVAGRQRQQSDRRVAQLGSGGMVAALLGLASLFGGLHGETAAAADWPRSLALQGVTFTVNSRGEGSMRQLTVQALEGGRGHDRFEVVENCLVRRFPIYKSGDSHATPTGGQRQICYKLMDGEAGFSLRATSVVKF